MNPSTTDLDSKSVADLEQIWSADEGQEKDLETALSQDKTPVDHSTPEPIVEETPASDELIEPPAPAPYESESSFDLDDDITDELFSDEAFAPDETSTEPQAVSTEPAEIQDPEELNPKQQHAWAELKHRAKEAERELEETRSKLQATQTDDTETKALKAQLNAAEERLGQLDLTRTRAFQERYNLPLQVQAAKAAKLMAREGVDPNEAKVLTMQLARASYEDRKNVLADRFPEAMGALVNIFEELESLDSNRTQAVNEWKDTQQALKAAIDAEQHGAVSQKLEQTTEQTVQKLVTARDVMFGKRDGNEKWNKSVDDRVAMFKGTIRAGNPNDLAYFIAKGIASNDMEKILKSEIQKRRALAAELKAIRGAAPDVSASRSGTVSQNNQSSGSTEAVLSQIWDQ